MMYLTLPDPIVAEKITLEFLNRVDKTIKNSQQIRENARENYTPQQWTPYICHLLYNPTRIDQNVLSLFGDYVEYNGGTHVSKASVSVNYDLTTGDVLTLAGILAAGADPSVLPELVIRELALKANDLFLYEDFEETVIRRFQGDFSEDEAFYFTSTGLCFYFAPYEIAPYSTGTVSVEIPYERLRNILYQSYIPPSHEVTDGTVSLSYFDHSEVDDSQLVEAILAPDGICFQATVDKTVYNVKLSVKSEYSSTYDRILFHLNSLSPGQIFIIEVQEAQLGSLLITYENSSGIQEIYL